MSKPEINQTVRADLEIQPNGELVITDRDGPFYVDDTLQMALARTIETSTVRELQELQSVFSACHTAIRNAIARKGRRGEP